MNTRDTLALMAGFGTGYMQQGDKERAIKQNQDNIDWQNNLRQRDQAAYDLAQKQKADLVAAAAPQAPVALMQKPDTADNIDVGQDASATLTPTGQYNAGGTTYADQGSAQAAATAANTPTAQMARMAQAYRVNGDPVAAVQLESQARQAQLGQLQLDAAQQEANARKFNAGLTTAIGQGHQAIADYLTKSGGDGHGGGLKAEVVPSADGKTVQYKLTKPDGTSTLTDPFSNDKNGAIEAGFGYTSQMTPEMLSAHSLALSKDKREQQSVDQKGVYQQLMGEAAMARAEASQTRAEFAAERARMAAQTTKDPVLQAQLTIAGKQLEQTTDQINRLRASPDYDPTKPPKGEASLLASQGALQQKLLDLVGGRGHPGGVPSVFNTPAPAAPHAPTSRVAQMVAAAPPGSWVNPDLIKPGAPAVAPMGAPTALMMADPRLRASADAQRDTEAQSAAAGLAFQRLMQERQAAQMTHGAN